MPASASEVVYGWAYHPEDGFQGRYKTKAEAVAAARAEGVCGEPFYIGWGRVPNAGELIDVAIVNLDWIFEDWEERIAEDELGGGELCDGWLCGLSHEAKNKLVEVIKQWARENAPVDWWIATDHERTSL